MAPKQWKRDDQKRIETALALSSENDPTRFQTAAAQLHQTSVRDVMQYYDDLVHDINLIESGQVATIDYPDYSAGTTKHMVKKRARSWTEEEHRKFLEGLAKFGEGYNKSISRHMRTRTPTQVASHAQKYFKRQKMESNAKKRSSIHDITSVDIAADNVTVSESGSNSTMMDQPHLGQEMSPDYHHSSPPRRLFGTYLDDDEDERFS